MDLQQEFQAAVERVNNLPADVAAAHMTELYGLFKQATEGDHDMPRDEVDADAAENPSGPRGMSQAQWESWSKCKGMPEEEAKRQYVARAGELTAPSGTSAGDGSLQPPSPSQVENTTTSQQPATGPGASQGGLRGDFTAGAPYGGEDRLKGEQEV